MLMNVISAVLLLRGSYQHEILYNCVFKGAIVCLQSKGLYKTDTESDATTWKSPPQLSKAQWFLALASPALREQQSSNKDYAKITFITQPSKTWPIKPTNYNTVSMRCWLWPTEQNTGKIKALSAMTYSKIVLVMDIVDKVKMYSEYETLNWKYFVTMLKFNYLFNEKPFKIRHIVENSSHVCRKTWILHESNPFWSLIWYGAGSCHPRGWNPKWSTNTFS